MNRSARSLPLPARTLPRLLSSIALALALAAGASRAASVRGMLVGGNPAAPLEGAEVVLRRAADSTVVAHTTTGADGGFRVDSLAFDRYLLRASLIGYEPWRRSDVVLSAAARDLDLGRIELVLSPILVQPVDVSTARATAIMAPDRNVYLTRDLPSSNTGTATDVLRGVPELDVDIDGHVSLRGSSSVNVQFDGRVSPLTEKDLDRYLRQMPGNRIERVEVMANPSAKYDPEGTAGIVNIVLKKNVDIGLSGSVTGTLGQRYSSPGAHVAWQRGKLSLFSGFSGAQSHWNYQSSKLRQSFLTSPPTSYASNSDLVYTDHFANLDASIDYAFTRRATLYGTINGYMGSGDTQELDRFVLTDASQAETSHNLLAGDEEWDARSPAVTVGLQHVVQGGRNERSIEYLESHTDANSRYTGSLHTLIPVGIDDELTRVAGNNDFHQRSLQIDDTHPVGQKGKVELGYKGSERVTLKASGLLLVQGSPSSVTDGSTFEDRERLHSGYLTLGQTVGRFSYQLGARAEMAQRTFDSRSTGTSYDHDYTSLFPSANVAWDLGPGRTLRATYSERIERPKSDLLNPDVPITDSLNIFVGNPFLGPQYTHSYAIDAGWSGSRGSLRLSPYYRNTIDAWDLVTKVDAGGAATQTWVNATYVRVLGVSLTGSLRQVNRLGGTMSVGVSREHNYASDLADVFDNDVLIGSATGNVVYKVLKTIDLQAYVRYEPRHVLAQGYETSDVRSTLGVRWRPSEKFTGALTVSDPFNAAQHSNAIGDATYLEIGATHTNVRGVSGSLTWSWGGKAPVEMQRRQHSDTPLPTSPGRP
jgi:outer membrane receptor protein involved in Fe transport